MRVVGFPRDPEVLSYHALRRAVGWIALLLPGVLAGVGWAFSHHLEASISAYYWTSMRDIFVGSLCAVGLFQFCCVGYDRWDEIGAWITAISAVGVAWFPVPREEGHISAHYVFAAILFVTLALFCLLLFPKSTKQKLTVQKIYRNRIFYVCGWTILASIIAMLGLSAAKIKYLGPLGATFCFETVSLFAFGVAWLAKGQTFLRDAPVSNKTLSQDVA